MRHLSTVTCVSRTELTTGRKAIEPGRPGNAWNQPTRYQRTIVKQAPGRLFGTI